MQKSIISFFVQIVVICSEGAFKRQQSLLQKEVLNIPDGSTMDGLFSAGLKFIQVVINLFTWTKFKIRMGNVVFSV